MRIGESGSASVHAGWARAGQADAEAAVAPPAAAAKREGPGAAATLARLAVDGTAGALLHTKAAAQSIDVPVVDGYRRGEPQVPVVLWDEDFLYGSAAPSRADYLAAAEWRAKLAGAQLLRPDLADATRAYAHYWSNSGATLQIDYARAFREDAGIRTNVHTEIARTAAAVDVMARSGQAGTFSVTGQAHGAAQYPVTENWQKAIGGYQQWSSADVRVEGDRVTMTVRVHVLDRYNFNRGQADIASGAPDDANGRFTELGWARPFDTRGELTRTVSWTLGQPPAVSDVAAQSAGR